MSQSAVIVNPPHNQCPALTPSCDSRRIGSGSSPCLLHTHYPAEWLTLFSATSYRTFSVLTLPHHQFACQFLLIGFHPTRITDASLYERIKWFFPSTMPGSLPGNQPVTPLAINYPELCHCFPSFIKPRTIFLPLWLTAAMMTLHIQWTNKREIQASGINDKQWQYFQLHI